MTYRLFGKRNFATVGICALLNFQAIAPPATGRSSHPKSAMFLPRFKFNLAERDLEHCSNEDLHKLGVASIDRAHFDLSEFTALVHSETHLEDHPELTIELREDIDLAALRLELERRWRDKPRAQAWIIEAVIRSLGDNHYLIALKAEKLERIDGKFVLSGSVFTRTWTATFQKLDDIMRPNAGVYQNVAIKLLDIAKFIEEKEEAGGDQ